MKEECITVRTASSVETINLGNKLGKTLYKGDVIALEGELGSGKTCFTKGLALGLGVLSETIITSPSFPLINEYEGRLNLFHMDVYRLESISDFLSAGLDEYFYMDGVVAMEWAERWPEVLPKGTLKIKTVIIDDQARKITFSGVHSRALEILKKLKGTGAITLT